MSRTLPRTLLCALGALVTSLSLVALPGASASSSAQKSSTSLSISPEVFVGGQSLTFTGTLAGAPNSSLKIQTLFNRPGDSWNTRDGVVASTNGAGDYAFTYPGPNNFGISYRVLAGNGTTSPAVMLEPRQQEVVLTLNGGAEQAGGTVVSGEAFTLGVNTTPTGRGNLGRPAPPFPGRTIDLQQRVRTDQWETIDTTSSDADGAASFTVTAGDPGDLAYRVRLDDIKTDGNEIGWFPSFPLLVDVVAPGTAAPAKAETASSPSTTSTTTARATSSKGATPLASTRYKWGPFRYDFAWEGGESLTDQPYRGTHRTGTWIDTSDGSGRVAHYNGGMALSTNVSEFPGTGDFGTTTATLTGNSMTYGRWEFRRRIDVFEDAGADYRVKIELVPALERDARCGLNVITVADVAFNSARARIGVSSARAQKAWSGSRRIPRLGDGAHTFGIEVTRRNVTWFLDGESLATLKRKAVPRVPLTPRLSLVGRGDTEMRRTRVLYDWQRGWALNRQAKASERGKRIKASAVKSRC
ncbi:hypothetical protein [Nocardioides sp.]|uniref:hypothetical protein n=1 Tax=Nocardioides sp. TaxID=35761 RepID=UPI002B27093D|nr:hypothetical protein [Nocardioides sp.]